MNIETTAECVECPTVIDELSSLGVDYVQGFAIGEPIPLDSSNIWN
jgi:EAL domain-containing protein (putative c-di-GMP-specific phosphodiesterase class I)